MAEAADTSDEPDNDRPSSANVDDTMPASPPKMSDRESRASIPHIRPSQPSERYRLGVELGRGGMGRVVEAFDMQLGRTVALKEALPRGGSGANRRFDREVQITARLEHASIVPLYDSGKTPDGRPFYVMRKVTGKPLDEMISRARGLGERLTLLPALLAAFDALAHAHRRGVIHRDLKPANILVGDLGETVVIDWGLAKVIGEEDPSYESIDPIEPRPSDSLRTQVGSVFGTPGFMAPEQARGEDLSTRSDVYALGACLYQMLAGTPPFGGSTSATEVIDRTRKNQVKPLKETAPGAPKELVAIVEKAMAFDAKSRYANAAQLGEDVRRFLTGQLVAAHRYTRRQRVYRFAKKNRLTLTISAGALVAIAILLWLNVHRVLVERQMARDDAEKSQAHADELLIQNAYNYLQTDPTHALAALRQLEPGSSKENEARAIAEAAVARGVAWGIDLNDEDPMPADVSPDGRRVSISTLSGTLQIYDLDSHQLVRTKVISRGARGTWVEGGRRLLVWGGEAPPYLLDPSSNQMTPLPIEKLSWLAVADSGDHALVEMLDHSVQRYTVATNTLAPVWSPPPDAKLKIALAYDGNTFATDDGHLVTLYDATGNVIVTQPFEDRLVKVVASLDHRVGLMSATAVYEVDLDAKSVSERHLDLPLHTFVMDLIYRGTELTCYTTDGAVRGSLRGRWIERTRTPNIMTSLVTAGTGVVLAATSDKLVWATDTSRGEIPLPNIQPVRMNARQGSPRVIVAARGTVFVFDVSHTVPQRLGVTTSGSQFTMLDDDTVLTWTNSDPWALFHLSTRQRVEIPFRWAGFGQLGEVRGDEKRALVRFSEIRTHLLELRDDPKPMRHLASGPSAIDHPDTGMIVGALIPGDATMFADAENRLYATFGDAHPNEIVQLDGVVKSITAIGHLKFGAITDNGEVVRGSLEGNGTLERTRVPARDDLGVMGDLQGHLYIAAGKELLVWDSSVESVAKFERPLTGLWPVAGGLLIALSDRSLMAFDSETKATRLLVPRNARAVQVTPDGTLMAAMLDSGHIVVTEFPDGEPWELPGGYLPGAGMSITPTTRSIVVGESDLEMWKLPRAGADLHAWIDAQTNARERSHRVEWPWQGAVNVDP